MKQLIKSVIRSTGFELRKIPKVKPGYSKDVAFLKEGGFSVDYTEAKLDNSTYFAPGYAMHRPAVQGVLQGMLYEPDTHKFVTAFCARHAGSMVHAGTFFGDMLPTFSAAVKGRVYAFEPVLESYVLAKLCIAKNDLSNVLLFNAGLGSELQGMKINTVQTDGRHAGGASRVGDAGQPCVVMNIDRVADDKIVLIQLDVEGFELQALEGAQATITRCRPVIAIEDNEKACDSFLEQHNYVKAAQIPGLDIWCPAENDDYLSDVKTIAGA